MIPFPITQLNQHEQQLRLPQHCENRGLPTVDTGKCGFK